MIFADVIGQKATKQHLVEMVQHNRLSHALMFLGREGSGALPLALALANYVAAISTSREENTTSGLFGGQEEAAPSLPASAEAADAFMQRKGISSSKAMMHADIHYSYPVITKKPGTPPISTDFAAEWREFVEQFPYGNVFDWLQFIGAENKQGNITAHECNDIIRKLNLKSFENGYKILVMWMPEYLGKEGNKLLKLIEEPPPDTLFILVAESESSILATIRSRCQLVKVPAIEKEEVEKALVERARCEPSRAKLLANASSGNYREALNLLQHADEDFHHLLKEWLNATLKNQPLNQSKIIEELARLGREKQKQFLRYFIHMLESALRLEVSGDDGTGAIAATMSETEKDFASRLNRMVNFEKKDAIATELDKASYYIERNANAKILFHALSIKIYHIVKNNIIVSV